jgi:hypothetical protein
LSAFVGVGAGVAASVVEGESAGIGVLVVFLGALVDGVGVDVGVGVGVGEESGVGVLLSVGDAGVSEGVGDVAVPSVRLFTAESTPLSTSFFSTISRRKGFELNQLACARARKRAMRAKTRNCCRENIFAMVWYCMRKGRRMMVLADTKEGQNWPPRIREEAIYASS